MQRRRAVFVLKIDATVRIEDSRPDVSAMNGYVSSDRRLGLLSEFPKLKIEPGSYACVVKHSGGQRLQAQLHLNAAQHPQGEIFDWPLEQREVYSFPQPEEHFAMLQCDLRMGLEALLFDVSVEAWFPGRAHMRATLAVVGHGLFDDPSRVFYEISLQITEGHRLFGVAPLASVIAPQTLPGTGKVQFSVEVDIDANRTYQSGGTELRCRYWLTHTLLDYFQFHIRSAPIFEVKSAAPLAPTEWLSEHVLPLRELVTLATLQPQTVAWVTFHEDYEVPSGRTMQRTYQLFSREVEQTPYAPNRDQRRDGITLFSFSDLPYSPVELLRRWEELRQTHPGFVQPLMQALTEQMNPRARFLFLVQALEGLHHQTSGDGPTPVEDHRAKRKALLRAARDAGMETGDVRWLDRWLDRYGRYTLEERLAQLRDAVREDVAAVADLRLVPGDIPVVRNRLSHGAEEYATSFLRPRMLAMSAIGVAHVLRLLGLPLDRLTTLFVEG